MFAEHHSEYHRNYEPRCTSCQLIRVRAEREALKQSNKGNYRKKRSESRDQ